MMISKKDGLELIRLFFPKNIELHYEISLDGTQFPVEAIVPFGRLYSPRVYDLQYIQSILENPFLEQMQKAKDLAPLIDYLKTDNGIKVVAHFLAENEFTLLNVQVNFDGWSIALEYIREADKKYPPGYHYTDASSGRQNKVETEKAIKDFHDSLVPYEDYKEKYYGEHPEIKKRFEAILFSSNRRLPDAYSTKLEEFRRELTEKTKKQSSLTESDNAIRYIQGIVKAQLKQKAKFLSDIDCVYDQLLSLEGFNHMGWLSEKNTDANKQPQKNKQVGEILSSQMKNSEQIKLAIERGILIEFKDGCPIYFIIT